MSEQLTYDPVYDVVDPKDFRGPLVQAMAEGDEMVGDAIAVEGMEYLLAINSGRRDIAAKTAA